MTGHSGFEAAVGGWQGARILNQFDALFPCVLKEVGESSLSRLMTS